MGTMTETYVDPAIAASSGSGTIGDPYGDLQYALDTMTRDSTNGDRINIKAGTDEILAAALNLTTYGTPTEAAPLLLQGYTSTAGDGGFGGIDLNASYLLWASTIYDFIHHRHLIIHNGGNDMINIRNGCSVFECELKDNATANKYAINLDQGGRVVGCYIHNCKGTGIYFGSLSSIAYFNVIQSETNAFDNAMWSQNYGNFFIGNHIILSGGGKGYFGYGDAGFFAHNVFYSSSGTGTGIDLPSNDGFNTWILNNIFEGFSGAGGKGINSAAVTLGFVGYNAFYNNTTDQTLGDVLYDDRSGNDQSLASSALNSPGSLDFALSSLVKALGYPKADIMGLYSGNRPYLDIGALQRQEPTSGGTGERSSVVFT